MTGGLQVHGNTGEWVEVAIERHSGEKDFHVWVSLDAD
jgi:hypothetical protein